MALRQEIPGSNSIAGLKSCEYLEATTTLWLPFALLKGRRHATLCTNVWYFVQEYLQATLKGTVAAHLRAGLL